MLTSQNRQQRYIDPSSAQTYSNNNTVQFNQGNNFINSYGYLIKGPALDLGCGTGELTASIANKLNIPITGMDISEARIKFANEHYGSEEIKFIVGNATTLDVPPNSYNTIMSFNTLHHVPTNDQLQVFRAAKDALTPDGVILFLIPGRSPEMHDAITETAASNNWKQYFSDFDLTKVRTYQTPEYYKILCEHAGFNDCEVVAEHEKGGKELDVKGMKDFLSGWLPHLAHLKIKMTDPKESEMLQNKLLDDIVRLYFSKMHKEMSETVEPVITQNKIVASKAGLFKRAALAAQAMESEIIKLTL